MPGFGSSGRFNFGDGEDKQTLVGKVTDIKSAPGAGEKRIIVREKSGARASVAVDMPAGCSKDIERKETYCFTVQEKNQSREGCDSGRKKPPSYRAYDCEDKPSLYTGREGRGDAFNRFGNDERGGGTDRSKRKFL